MEGSNKTLRLFFIRHCTTRDSEAKRYSGKATPLNQQGVAEATRLAERFTEISLARIYTSPYERALQTAKIIQRRCRCPLEIIENLREVNHGLWRAYTVEEVKELWKKEFAARGRHPATVPPTKGETIKQLQERALKALKKVINLNSRGNILIVTHGGIIHTLWMYLVGVNLNSFWNFTKMNEIRCGDIYLLDNAEKFFSKRKTQVQFIKL